MMLQTLHKRLFAVALVWLATSTLQAQGQAVQLESAATQTALVELYTSEGCSSCPPADRWISQLRQDSRLWREVVPIAFHVDYWDYIGWPDRFASPLYGERQRSYAATGGVSQVYTPGLVVNGQEWRRWFVDPKLSLEQAPEVGVLKLGVQGLNVKASFQPTDPLEQPLKLHLAVLGFDLTSDVGAGENRGKRLQHDFVVLGYQQVDLLADAGGYRISTLLPKTQQTTATTALVGWLSAVSNPKPLQAVGGWMTGS